MIGELITGFRTALVLLAITAPLAIWKAVEIIIWVTRHVSVSWL